MAESKGQKQGESGKSVPIGQSTGEQGGGSRAIEQSREQRLGRQGGASRQALTPFSFMRRMMDDVDRMFGQIGGGILAPSFLGEDIFEQGPAALGPVAQAVWAPQIELFERDGNLVVRADLPGLEKKDLCVDVSDDTLTIAGERRSEQEEKREGYFHSERSYGSFQRRIRLPQGVDASTVDAVFDNGVLEVSMKLPKEQPRTIQIRGGGAPAMKGGPSAQEEAPAQTQAGPASQQPRQAQNGPQSTRH